MVVFSFLMKPICSKLLNSTVVDKDKKGNLYKGDFAFVILDLEKSISQ